MKQLILTFSLSIIIFCSCAEKPKDNSEKLSDSEIKTLGSEYTDSTELMKIFSQAVRIFPSDSASLYWFYFKAFPAKTQEKIQKQIDRIESLLTKQSVERYKKIENDLKPLLTEIVEKKTLSCSQAENLVILYSDYDNFRGESLLSNLLVENDNYLLVWESFRIIARESNKDTCYISALIELDKNIRTNAELSEAMTDFIITSIKNNPKGFLDMFSNR